MLRSHSSVKRSAAALDLLMITVVTLCLVLTGAVGDCFTGDFARANRASGAYTSDAAYTGAGVLDVYADDIIDDKVIPDDDLREVLTILANYWAINGSELYDEAGVDPHTTDITQLDIAEAYKGELSRDVLESYPGTVDLFCYDITSLKGINYAKKVTSIVMPHAMSSIEGEAFKGMDKLEEVLYCYCPKDAGGQDQVLSGLTLNSEYITIGDSAFENCISLTHVASSVYAQNEHNIDLRFVSKIGNRAFASCSSMDGLKFDEPEYDNGVPVYNTTTEIGDNAFYSCLSISSVTLPVGELGTGVFSDCFALTYLEFVQNTDTDVPNGFMTNAGTAESAGLGVEIVFPADMQSIGNNACNGCVIKDTNLSECTSLKTIGNNAFRKAQFDCSIDLTGCTALETICQHSFSGILLTQGHGEVRLPDDLRHMGNGVFMEAKGLTKINIPKYLEAIPGATFLICSDLAEVTVPDGARFESIGPHAFELCAHLEDINFISRSSRLTSIGDHAFAKCIPTYAEYQDEMRHGLKTVVIPDNVTEIGEAAFEDDFMITSMDLGEGIVNVPANLIRCENNSPSFTSFSLTDPVSGNTFTYQYESIGGLYRKFVSISEMSELTDVKLSSKVATIGDGAFFGNSAIEKVTYQGDTQTGPGVRFGSRIASIGKSAFANCSRTNGSGTDLTISGIETVILPDAMIANNTALNESLEEGEAEFPVIGERAFRNDFSLSAVTLPRDLREIPDYCFDGCGKIVDSDYYGLRLISDLSRLEYIGDYAFRDCCRLRYAGSEGEAITFGRNLTYLGQYSFAGTDITSAYSLHVTSIKSIMQNTFENCRDLTVVNCPDGYREFASIGSNAFKDCPKLTQVMFPVYASLADSMLFGDMQQISLTPNLGVYSDMTYRVPTGQTVKNFPAKAFANCFDERISQYNVDTKKYEIIQDLDDPYFTVTHSGNNYEVTGGSTVISGTKAQIEALLRFRVDTDLYVERPVTIAYPIDVIEVHADTVELDKDSIRVGVNTYRGAVGKVSDEDNTPVLYINSNRVGQTLKLAAKAFADEDDYPGMITNNTEWTVVEGEALTLDGDADNKMTSAEVCTTTADFTVGGIGESLVRIAFYNADNVETASMFIKVLVIDPITSLDYYIGSIGNEDTGYSNPDRISMREGMHDTITVVPVYKTPGNDQKDYVVYSIENPKPAGAITVDQSGHIDAVAAGTATVRVGTATGSITNKTFTVTVKESGEPLEPTYIEITGDIGTDGKGHLYTGETAEYDVNYIPSYATPGVTWTTNHDPDATLETTPQGKARITGVNAGGSVSLKATADNGGATRTLGINIQGAASLLDYRGGDLEINTRQNYYSMKVSAADDPETVSSGIVMVPATAGEPVTFTSSNVNVLALGTTGSASACTERTVTISKDRNLYYKGISQGDAVITAETQYSHRTLTINVHVIAPAMTIVCDNPAVYMLPGGGADMQITKTPADSEDKITYRSNNTGIATVDEFGRITGVAAGSTRIYATSVIGNATTFCDVYVQIPATSLSFRSDDVLAAVDADNTLRLASSDGGQTSNSDIVRTPADSNESVTFTSDNTSVVELGTSAATYSKDPVSINSKNGELHFRGIKAGTAHITAETASGASAMMTVTVLSDPITSITTTTPAMTLRPGQSGDMAIQIVPESSPEEPVFESSNSGVATVDANGKVTAVAAGTARITARGRINSTTARTYCDVKVLSQAEIDSAEAAEADLVLEALPDAKDVMLSDEEEITDARAVYNALTTDQKGLVKASAYKKLTDAEERIAALKAEIRDVINAINAIPSYETIQATDAPLINDAEAAYEDLTDEQKTYISDALKETLAAARESLTIAEIIRDEQTDPGEPIGESDISDDKLRQVIQILVNYKFEKRRDFYADNNIDPYTKDITTMPEAAAYDKPASKKLLSSYVGAINLAPYTEIGSLDGINLAKNAVTVVLPAVLAGDDGSAPLTKIEATQFMEMTGLRNVVMPATVTEIGDSAFEKCGSLVSITVSGSGHSEGDKTADLTHVRKIGSGAFASCSSLDNVSLYEAPPSDTEGIEIGSNAFTSCASLTAIDVPAGRIDTGVFQSCRNLATVKFADTYKVIPGNTLSGVKPEGGLTVTFPEDLEEIGVYAFSGSVIKTSNLADCSKLQRIGEYAFYKADIGFLVKLDGTKLNTIDRHAFYGANFKEGAVTLPDSLTNMGLSVFFATTGLTSINIPKKLPAIPAGTFMYSYDLSEVIVPAHAQFASVGAHAFDMCGNLTDIDFLANSDELTTIGDYAFARCVPKNADYRKQLAAGGVFTSGLKDIVIPDTVTAIGASAFANDFLVTSADLTGDEIKDIPENLLRCDDSNSISIENITLTDENSGATETYDFSGSDQLLKSIKSAFSGYPDKMRNMCSIGNVTLSAQTETIGSYAFYGKKRLTVTYDGDSNVSDGSLHFMNVKSIGESAFRYCSATTGSNANAVTSGITSLILPDTIETIGRYAFADDYTLRTAYIPSTLKTIPAYCFSKCSNLRSVLSLTGVETIGNNAFEECSSITEVRFGKKLASLGASAFGKCTSLRTLTGFSDTGIETIAARTFENCRALEAVNCPDSLSAINDYAFSGCISLTTINFPVYATLSASMLSGDTQDDLYLTPTLGRYRNTVYRVPVGTKRSLPAEAFARATDSTGLFSQRDKNGAEVLLSEADPRYFELDHKGNSYEITGGSIEMKGTGGKAGTAAIISAEIPFTDSSPRTMSIEYPVDIVGVHADQETMEFVPDNFKLNSDSAGLTVYHRDGKPVIYVSRSRIGSTLTLEATAVSLDEEFPG